MERCRRVRRSARSVLLISVEPRKLRTNVFPVGLIALASLVTAGVRLGATGLVVTVALTVLGCFLALKLLGRANRHWTSVTSDELRARATWLRGPDDGYLLIDRVRIRLESKKHGLCEEIAPGEIAEARLRRIRVLDASEVELRSIDGSRRTLTVNATVAEMRDALHRFASQTDHG